MRSALIYVHGYPAGRLLEEIPHQRYVFTYLSDYSGPAVSLRMPVAGQEFVFDRFPPFFDGLLPEGWLLESLLRREKLDRSDSMGQLLIVGGDTVGAVTAEPELAEQ